MQSQQVKAIKTNKYTINAIKRVHTRSKSRKATQIKKIHLQTLETRIDYSRVIDLSRNTNKEIKRSMIELDRRSGGEKSLIRRFSPLPSSFFFSPCSFALFLSFSELSIWSGMESSKMERSPAINSLCHDLNSVRRQLCTARTKVVRLGRTRWESAKSGTACTRLVRPGRTNLVRAVPNLVRAVPSLVRPGYTNLVRPGRTNLVRPVPSLVRVVPGSPKTPFLRVFCSNPAENKQTLSSTKF